MIQMDVLQFLIEKSPGRSAGELAVAIHGPGGAEDHGSHVNEDCQRLARVGRVQQTGKGVNKNPFCYFPA